MVFNFSGVIEFKKNIGKLNFANLFKTVTDL